MRLWHCMPVEVFDKTIELDKPYICDISKSELLNNSEYDSSNFKNAYDWLVSQMNIKISNPDNIAYPVWAWHTYDGRNKKPDLRRRYFRDMTEPMFLIELEIPDSDVVLSDEPKWCISCLNNMPYFETDAEFETYENKLNDLEKREFLDNSWHRIFDIKDSDYIQACFWQLKPEYVRKIYRFNSYLSK